MLNSRINDQDIQIFSQESCISDHFFHLHPTQKIFGSLWKHLFLLMAFGMGIEHSGDDAGIILKLAGIKA